LNNQNQNPINLNKQLEKMDHAKNEASQSEDRSESRSEVVAKK
jgi:hypothetical protein